MGLRELLEARKAQDLAEKLAKEEAERIAAAKRAASIAFEKAHLEQVVRRHFYMTFGHLPEKVDGPEVEEDGITLFFDRDFKIWQLKITCPNCGQPALSRPLSGLDPVGSLLKQLNEFSSRSHRC